MIVLRFFENPARGRYDLYFVGYHKGEQSR